MALHPQGSLRQRRSEAQLDRELCFDHRLLGATKADITVHQRFAVVIGTIWDSLGTRPVHPSRVDLVGSSHFVLGDSLGRFVLPAVPRGRHVLKARGIGFIERAVQIIADNDTLPLPPILLWPNLRFDSLNVIAPR
ncbi:MAG: hypothetical protein ACREA0_14995 [bacterium]